MMRSYILRTGSLIALVVLYGVVSCGSDDGKKKAQGPRYEVAGEDSGGGSSKPGPADGGEPTTQSGGGGGGVPSATDGGMSPLGEAGGREAFGGAGGASSNEPLGGAAGAGGTADPGPRECPTGTADCDDNHEDCETNTASDATNCGRCERVCGGSSTCTTGWCSAVEILNSASDSNYCGWTFNATTAYMLTCWGSFTEIRSAPLTPGQTITGTQIQTHNLPVAFARGMLIDGNDVLYGVQGNPSYLYKFPLNATGPADVTIGYTFENGMRFDGLQLVGDTFYWNNNSHTAAGQIQPGFIRKRAKNGTSSTTLISGLGLNGALQVFSSNMVWLEQRTMQDVMSVYRAPIAGADLADVELVTAVASGSYLTRRGDYAYWTYKVAAPNGKVQRLRVDDDAAVVEDVATGLQLPEGIITDESYVYFKQSDSLYRVPLAGGTPERLSTPVPANDAQATALYHVDEQYVYFAAGANAGASTVVRVAK